MAKFAKAPGNSNDQKKENKNELVISYLKLRNLIGFSGILLPLVLAIAPQRPSGYYGFEPSISDYFYTDRGDILVVILCVLGTFLITYMGYNWIEKLLTSVAGVCSIGVAFVPTKMDCLECNLSVHTGSGGVFSFIAGTGWHFAFAVTFFLCLAVMSLVFFTRGNAADAWSKQEGKLSQKAKRNIVFKLCGWVIISCLIVIGLYFIIKPELGGFPVIFVFETIAVVAFGLSWITKGQTLWPDAEH